jgi:hypothetical protein
MAETVIKKMSDNPSAKVIGQVETTQLFSSGKNEFKKLNSQGAGNI